MVNEVVLDVWIYAWHLLFGYFSVRFSEDISIIFTNKIKMGLRFMWNTVPFLRLYETFMNDIKPDGLIRD